jgi:hypothetical protein
MTVERMDPQVLAAFADGELPPEEAARVVLHLARCPEDQAQVDAIMALTETLGRAYDPVLAAPLPPAMAALLAEPAPTVVPFRRRAPLATLAGLSLAAGLALAALFWPAPPPAPGLLAQGPVPARSVLAEVLAELPAGETRMVDKGAEAMVLATLPLPDGRHCREIEIATDAGALHAGLACTAGDGWDIVASLTLDPAPQDGGYVPASGAEVEALTAWLDAAGAGAALSPDAESALIGAGWR